LQAFTGKKERFFSGKKITTAGKKGLRWRLFKRNKLYIYIYDRDRTGFVMFGGLLHQVRNIFIVRRREKEPCRATPPGLGGFNGNPSGFRFTKPTSPYTGEAVGGGAVSEAD